MTGFFLNVMFSSLSTLLRVKCFIPFYWTRSFDTGRGSYSCASDPEAAWAPFPRLPHNLPRTPHNLPRTPQPSTGHHSGQVLTQGTLIDSRGMEDPSPTGGRGVACLGPTITPRRDPKVPGHPSHTLYQKNQPGPAPAAQSPRGHSPANGGPV